MGRHWSSPRRPWWLPPARPYTRSGVALATSSTVLDKSSSRCAIGPVKTEQSMIYSRGDEGPVDTHLPRSIMEAGGLKSTSGSTMPAFLACNWDNDLLLLGI